MPGVHRLPSTWACSGRPFTFQSLTRCHTHNNQLHMSLEMESVYQCTYAVYVCEYSYVHVYVYVHTYIHIQIHVYTCDVYIHACIYIYIYMYIHLGDVYIYTYMYMCLCMEHVRSHAFQSAPTGMDVHVAHALLASQLQGILPQALLRHASGLEGKEETYCRCLNDCK